MLDKKVLIDGEVRAYRDLFSMAEQLDASFGADGFCFSSGAASVLREHGYTVEAYHEDEDNELP